MTSEYDGVRRRVVVGLETDDDRVLGPGVSELCHGDIVLSAISSDEIVEMIEEPELGVAPRRRLVVPCAEGGKFLDVGSGASLR